MLNFGEHMSFKEGDYIKIEYSAWRGSDKQLVANWNLLRYVENRLPAMNLYLYFLLNMDCPVDCNGKKEIC